MGCSLHILRNIVAAAAGATVLAYLIWAPVYMYAPPTPACVTAVRVRVPAMDPAAYAAFHRTLYRSATGDDLSPDYDDAAVALPNATRPAFELYYNVAHAVERTGPAWGAVRGRRLTTALELLVGHVGARRARALEDAYVAARQAYGSRAFAGAAAHGSTGAAGAELAYAAAYVGVLLAAVIHQQWYPECARFRQRRERAGAVAALAGVVASCGAAVAPFCAWYGVAAARVAAREVKAVNDVFGDAHGVRAEVLAKGSALAQLPTVLVVLAFVLADVVLPVLFCLDKRDKKRRAKPRALQRRARAQKQRIAVCEPAKPVPAMLAPEPSTFGYDLSAEETIVEV